jgi:hypothetical protein
MIPQPVQHMRFTALGDIALYRSEYRCAVSNVAGNVVGKKDNGITIRRPCYV